MSTLPNISRIPESIPTKAEEPWPPRLPLPPVTTPVPTLPPSLLPATLRSFSVDIAERVSIPLEFVAVPLLTALGSVVGSAVGIRPMAYDDWLVVANLWGGIVGPPGVMKTAAIAEAHRALRRLEVHYHDLFLSAEADRDAELAGIEAKRKAARSRLEKATKTDDAAGFASAKDSIKALRAEEEALGAKERRFSTSDSTIEKLGEILTDNPRGILNVRDELTGWLRGLDREDRVQDRAFFLESWNGTSGFTWDRIGRGTRHVPRVTLSICGGIQPGRLGSYVAGAIEGEDDADGLVQRFQLLVWPDAFGEWKAVDRWPQRDARDRVFSIFNFLAEAEPAELGATEEADEIPFVRFAPDAQALFLEWRHALEVRLRSEELARTPAFCSHLAKYRSLFPKLALVFHLVEVADGGPVGAVSLRSAQMAGAWCDFLEVHARKVYSDELAGNLSAAHILARKLEEGAVRDGMTVRSIAEKDWSGLRRAGRVYAGAEELARLGWVRIEESAPGDRGGRPSTFLRVHPELRGDR